MQLLADRARVLCSATAMTSARCMLCRAVVRALFAALAPQLSSSPSLTPCTIIVLASCNTLAISSKISSQAALVAVELRHHRFMMPRSLLFLAATAAAAPYACEVQHAFGAAAAYSRRATLTVDP